MEILPTGSEKSANLTQDIRNTISYYAGSTSNGSILKYDKTYYVGSTTNYSFLYNKTYYRGYYYYKTFFKVEYHDYTIAGPSEGSFQDRCYLVNTWDPRNSKYYTYSYTVSFSNKYDFSDGHAVNTSIYKYYMVYTGYYEKMSYYYYKNECYIKINAYRYNMRYGYGTLKGLLIASGKRNFYESYFIYYDTSSKYYGYYRYSYISSYTRYYGYYKYYVPQYKYYYQYKYTYTRNYIRE